jgi:hypothetical protein
MTDGGDESMRVQLARMEGKLDLSNLRHEQTDAWKVTVDQRLHRHGNDIGALQQREMMREGEKQGLGKAGRLAWAGAGLIPGGAIVAALMKLLGA